MCYAGSIRSGKSYCSMGCLLLLASVFPGTRYAIVRASLASLKATSIPTFFKLCPKYFLKSYNQDTQTVTFTNGSQLIFWSESYDEDKELMRFQGLEVNGFAFEEANELQEATFNRCIQRAGSFIPAGDKPAPDPIIIMTCTPNNSWVCELFYDRFIDGTLPPDFYFLQAHITDNPFITKNLAFMESLKNLNSFDYKVQVEGQWHLEAKTAGSFHRSFDIDLHTGQVQYDPAEPLHISFDENVNPYVPLLICQIVNGQFRAIGEITGVSPNNKLSWVCDEFCRLYADHKSGLFVYGDRTSNKEDTKLAVGMNFFRLAMEHLKQYRPSLRLPNVNPSVVLAGSWIDTVFEGKRKGISILIGSQCVHTIRDMQNLKTDVDGKKLKKVIRDPKTGTSYQQFGHFSDALTYCITFAFASDYSDYQRGDRPHLITIGKNAPSKNSY